MLLPFCFPRNIEMTILRSTYNHGYDKEYSEEINDGLFRCRVFQFAEKVGLTKFVCSIDGMRVDNGPNDTDNIPSVITSEMKEILLRPFDR